MNRQTPEPIRFEVQGPVIIETDNVKPGVYSIKMQLHTALHCPVIAYISGEAYFLESEFEINPTQQTRLGVYKKVNSNHAKTRFHTTGKN